MRFVTGLAIVASASAIVGCGDDSGSGSGDRSQRYEATLTVLESPDHGPQLCRNVMESDPPQCGGLPVDGWDWAKVDGETTAQGITWGGFRVVGTFDGHRLTLTEPPTTGPAEPEPVRRFESKDFEPACETPDVVDSSEGGAEWEAMSQDYGPLEIPDLVAAWASDPAGEWDGPFVGNIVVLPGRGAETLAIVRVHYAGPVCIVERDGPTEAELKQVQDQLMDPDARAELGTQTSSVNLRQGHALAEVWVADDQARAYADDRWGDLVELVGILQPVG